MAEQYPPQGLANNSSAPEETTDRGCFDFFKKKEHKTEEDLIMTDLDTAKEAKQEEEKHTLMEELQRTHTHSSSSSEEEVEEGAERKKKKKKGLKEALKEKISGGQHEPGDEGELKDTSILMEKSNEEENGKTIHPEEGKGLIEKIKEKLPGQHDNSSGEEHRQAPPPKYEEPVFPESETNKEKKGIIDKIKEKLPGHHKSHEHELKED